jgi:bacterial/archaeal transporter family protein
MKTEYYVLASIFGWGIGSFLYKNASASVHPIITSTIAMGLYIILLPLVWFIIKFDHTITANGIIYSLLGALCMCIATLSFSYALYSGGAAGKMTILCSLYPALTLLLSMFFLKETINIKQGIGIVLALISFALMSLK